MKIKEMWEELESDKTFSSGTLLRGFGKDFLPDVFIALNSAEKYRCLAASVNVDLNVELTAYTGLEDLEIVFIPQPGRAGRKLLLFKLLNSLHHDIFSILCEDLISSISNIDSEATLVRSLLNRFENWNMLFKKGPGDWLSQESQRGLYGELYFLRKLLNLENNYIAAVNTWVGCENQVRDFQYGQWAVEVKTTKGNNHQKIHINGDRQLDTSHLKCLFLFHLSLEALQSAGETLQEIVISLKTILEMDAASLNRFNTKLLFAGYRDVEIEHYTEIGYLIRNESTFQVKNDFPRIEENELRAGIGDLSYTIIVSACQDYIVDLSEVFNNLNLNG